MSAIDLIARIELPAGPAAANETAPTSPGNGSPGDSTFGAQLSASLQERSNWPASRKTNSTFASSSVAKAVAHGKDGRYVRDRQTCDGASDACDPSPSPPAADSVADTPSTQSATSTDEPKAQEATKTEETSDSASPPTAVPGAPPAQLVAALVLGNQLATAGTPTGTGTDALEPTTANGTGAPPASFIATLSPTQTVLISSNAEAGQISQPTGAEVVPLPDAVAVGTQPLIAAATATAVTADAIDTTQRPTAEVALASAVPQAGPLTKSPFAADTVTATAPQGQPQPNETAFAAVAPPGSLVSASPTSSSPVSVSGPVNWAATADAWLTQVPKGVAVAAERREETSDSRHESLLPAGSTGVELQSSATFVAVQQKADGADINPARLVRDVTLSIQSAHEGGNHLRLKLHPPELGSLQIDVSLKGGVVSARVEAQTAAAHRVLTENLPQLQEALAQQGLTVERLDVFLSDRNMGEGRPELADRSFQQGQQSGHEPPRDQSPTASTTASETSLAPAAVSRGPHLRQALKELDVKV